MKLHSQYMYIFLYLQLTETLTDLSKGLIMNTEKNDQCTMVVAMPGMSHENLLKLGRGCQLGQKI